MGLTDEELKMIGGSDAAAIAGIHPQKKPLDVYRRIVEGYVGPETKPMRRGTLMEPVIRAMAAEEFGLTLLGPRKLRHPQLKFLRASLDDVEKGADGEQVVEFKSVNPFAAAEYGEGEDEVPGHHICQVQFYLGMGQMPRARLFALIGIDELRSYTIRADLEIQSMLFEQCERFQKDHVLAKTPPPIDGSESCAEYLKAKFPKDSGTLLSPTFEDEQLVAEIREAKRAVKSAEELEKLLRNKLVNRLGDASGLEGLCSYKLNKGRRVVDWEAVCLAAEVPPSLVEKFATRNPFRSLRLTKGDDNE